MKAPFPWFGGKSRAAALVWARFGAVAHYVEPFAGSLAVLLANPYWPFRNAQRETINDLDCYVANFWRAVQRSPEEVAAYADNLVNEADLRARHIWLHGRTERVAKIKEDPDFFDARVAGYWCWGVSTAIGNNFCRPSRSGSPPHLGAGEGVHQRFSRSGLEKAVCAERRARLVAYFQQIADRLRFVTVCCGEWNRVLNLHLLLCQSATVGVLLDPPYDIDKKIYGAGTVEGLSSKVQKWAALNGENPRVRIALCGYKDETRAVKMPESWTQVEWRCQGGHNNRSGGRNRERERIWFSPHCLNVMQFRQLTFFG